MLLETEEGLPQWLRRHVQFEKFVEYPNKPAPLKTRVTITLKKEKKIDAVMKKSVATPSPSSNRS